MAAVGELIADRYELEELVGTGGMSSVYRAHDTLLERKVALKVMHERFTEDGDYVERFRREARSVARLSHPNIVTVIDRGEFEGRQFIVFEYVDGENLKQLVQRDAPLPVEQALDLTIQVGRALAFAHQNGLVHRDVKPQNVLLNGEGQAKVTDFGIARSLDVQHGMTQTGTVLGTSDYIAPEQARGDRIDEQTDVYSLGVVLYELLAGDVPFPGENFVAVAMRHINEPPPSVRERRPDVPPRADAAIQRAMAKEAPDRFPSMDAFVAELQACLAEMSQGDGGRTMVVPVTGRPRRAARPARRAFPWPALVIVLGLAVAGVAGAALVLGRDDGRATETRPQTVPAAEPVELAAVGAFDPVGRDGEHDDEAPRATDDDPATYWRTSTYRSGLPYVGAGGVRKNGVGLVLDAGRPVLLTEVRVGSSTPDVNAEIRAGGNRFGPFNRRISANKSLGPDTQFEITATESARYYVVWITKIPAGTSARINEVIAR